MPNLYHLTVHFGKLRLYANKIGIRSMSIIVNWPDERRMSKFLDFLFESKSIKQLTASVKEVILEKQTK